jgi:hypothetical protein
MKFYKLKTLLICLTVAVLGSMTSTTQAGDEWIDNWKSFAAESGLPEHAAWVAAIDNAEVRALAKEWENGLYISASYAHQDVTEASSGSSSPLFCCNNHGKNTFWKNCFCKYNEPP